MPKLVVISSPTGWGIIGIGLLAGLLWVLPDYFQYQIYPTLYFRTAVIAVGSVLAFAALWLKPLRNWYFRLIRQNFYCTYQRYSCVNDLHKKSD